MLSLQLERHAVGRVIDGNCLSLVHVAGECITGCAASQGLGALSRESKDSQTPSKYSSRARHQKPRVACASASQGKWGKEMYTCHNRTVNDSMLLR